MRRIPLAVTALLLAAAPAVAQPIDFTALIDGHLGYAINPKLSSVRSPDSAFVRFRIAPTLTQATAVSQTTLSGYYNREQYFTGIGHTQALSGVFSHSQTFTEFVKGSVSAGYSQSNGALLNGNALDPASFEDLAFARKTRGFHADGSLSWQMTARDTLSLDASYLHEKVSGGAFDRSYDQYSGTFNYLHALNARTKIGIRTTATAYRAPLSGNSNSIGPSLALQQTLSPIWQLDADVGVIFQRREAPISTTTTSLGFHASLCGTYPTSSLCFKAARQSSASAFGGLRNLVSVSAEYTRKLTEHSDLSFTVSYDDSKSDRNALVRDTRIVRGQGSYDRKLNERLSVGLEASGAYRSSKGFGSARSVAGSIYARWKIG